MTHTEMKDFLAENHHVSKSEADAMLKGLFSKIADEVAEGKDVKLLGLGTIKRAKRSARTGRNPQTGEEIQIPEKFVAKLKVAKDFDEKLSQSK